MPTSRWSRATAERPNGCRPPPVAAVFRLQPGSGVRPIAWFEADNPLRSGWAWGAPHLKQAVAVAEADVGKGRLVLLGPLVAFRAHPHGTFKLLFNGLYVGSAQIVRLPPSKK